MQHCIYRDASGRRPWGAYTPGGWKIDRSNLSFHLKNQEVTTWSYFHSSSFISVKEILTLTTLKIGPWVSTAKVYPFCLSLACLYVHSTGEQKQTVSPTKLNSGYRVAA